MKLTRVSEENQDKLPDFAVSSYECGDYLIFSHDDWYHRTKKSLWSAIDIRTGKYPIAQQYRRGDVVAFLDRREEHLNKVHDFEDVCEADKKRLPPFADESYKYRGFLVFSYEAKHGFGEGQTLWRIMPWPKSWSGLSDNSTSDYFSKEDTKQRIDRWLAPAEQKDEFPEPNYVPRGKHMSFSEVRKILGWPAHKSKDLGETVKGSNTRGYLYDYRWHDKLEISDEDVETIKSVINDIREYTRKKLNVLDAIEARSRVK